MSYWALNAIFLSVVAVVAVLALLRTQTFSRTGSRIGSRPGRQGRARPWWPAMLLGLGILLVFTAVFDNVMIGVGLVGYDEALISGAFIGIAPLEDFAYAIAAAILLPSLWMLLPARSKDVT